MRILFYSNWFIKQTVQLANALVEHHRVTLIFPEVSPELNAYDGKVRGLKEILAQGVELITLPHMQNLDLMGWIPVFKARSIIRESKPDIIHLNESYDFRSLMLMLLCPKIPFVTSAHDPIPHSDEKISLHGFKHWVRDQIRRRSAGLVVHGQGLRSVLSEYSGISMNKIYAVPHGEYRYYSHFDRKRDVPGSDDGKKVLFFGRWEHYKGIDILIEAEPLITKRVPGTKIILAGEGQLPLSTVQAKMVNPENFIVKNFAIPDEEVPDLFRQADVVVLPYREATQSGPLHIAGSFARPSVVTRVGAMPEVIQNGENGLLIEPEDPIELARAVCWLLENPEEARRIGENAKKQMATEESMERVAQVQSEVYQQVLRAFGSPEQGLVMQLMQSLVKKVKRDPNYALDYSMRLGDLVAMLWKLGSSLLRGLLHRPFLGKSEGLLFIGKRVRLRNRRHISVGRNFIAEDSCEIQGLSKEGIRFGDDVTVGSYAMIRPSGYYGREIGNGLKVGNGSNIGPYNYIGASGGIVIGDEVMMGPRVSLYAENHQFGETDVSMHRQGCIRKGIVIEDDCWLGGNCIILDGVTVGEGSIVAAGAVVTKNVPPYSIVAGNPARVIRSRRPDWQMESVRNGEELKV